MILRASHGYLFFPKISCTSKPNPSKRNHYYSIPARDRVIDFGKHKGKMMGTLPSSYLRWISNSLRAGDSLHWAHLADQVLQDPVYRDRIEWEFAEAVLNGNSRSSSSNVGVSVSGVINGNAASELLEISERFGWDNEDKDGWSKLKFELLGTSKGGRIPRLCNDYQDKVSVSPEGVSACIQVGIRTKEPRLCNINRDKVSVSPDRKSARKHIPTKSGMRTKDPRFCNDNGDKVSVSPDSLSACIPTKSGLQTKGSLHERGRNLGTAKLGPNGGSDSGDETGDEKKGGKEISSRMRRIERVRLKLKMKNEGGKEDKVQFFGGNSIESRIGASRTQSQRGSGSYSFMNGVSLRNEEKEEESRIGNEPEVYNPFPGRESLLRKVLNRGRRK